MNVMPNLITTQSILRIKSTKKETLYHKLTRTSTDTNKNFNIYFIHRDTLIH